MHTSRAERLRHALFRGDQLRLDEPRYRQSVRTFLDELVSSDLREGDRTARALGIVNDRIDGRILAKEPGVAAGIGEFCWLLQQKGIETAIRNRDGDPIECGDVLVEFTGGRCDLLALERVGLNLLQRMCGIATMTRNYQEQVHRHNPAAFVVGTRKTPWGLLDKRAVHLGGGGTHRLGLWDAILIKNNHLSLLAKQEAEALSLSIERAWGLRDGTAFVEVEVRSRESAMEAARIFRLLQQAKPAGCESLLMLDNFTPADAVTTIKSLREEGLHDHVLVEVSGNISATNLGQYAECGADALSVGSLTHSPAALDICQRL